MHVALLSRKNVIIPTERKGTNNLLNKKMKLEGSKGKDEQNLWGQKKEGFKQAKQLI